MNEDKNGDEKKLFFIYSFILELGSFQWAEKMKKKNRSWSFEKKVIPRPIFQMDYFNNINLKCVTADWIGRHIYIYACKLKEGKVKRKGWICRKEKEHREMLNGIWWTRFKLAKLYIK